MTFLEPMCFLDARQIPMVDQLPKMSGVKILVPALLCGLAGNVQPEAALGPGVAVAA